MHKIRRLLLTTMSFGLMLLLSGCKLALLDPKGIIAADEKHILVTATLLMLIIVIPVVIMTFAIAWRYRESNTKAVYSPNWSHSTLLEIIWWSVPCAIIVVLATITWTSTHRLDPYRPLASDSKPITIQAIALEWRWLFIYPEQNIATINFVKIPVNTQVRFLVSAEGPMNSLQIPQLAGQIYAMAGMQTKLHLIADSEGEYRGLSTNFSGDGFSSMNFAVHVTSQEQFNDWVKTVKKTPDHLTVSAYREIAKPTEDKSVKYFASASEQIFAAVSMKSMMPMPLQDEEKPATELAKETAPKATHEMKHDMAAMPHHDTKTMASSQS